MIYLRSALESFMAEKMFFTRPPLGPFSAVSEAKRSLDLQQKQHFTSPWPEPRKPLEELLRHTLLRVPDGRPEDVLPQLSLYRCNCIRH